MAQTVQQRRTGSEQMGFGGVRAYATGQLSFAEHDAYKIRPSVTQAFGRGEAVLISGGELLQLHISQLHLPPEQIAMAQRKIALQGAFRLYRPQPGQQALGKAETRSALTTPSINQAMVTQAEQHKIVSTAAHADTDATEGTTAGGRQLQED